MKRLFYAGAVGLMIAVVIGVWLRRPASTPAEALTVRLFRFPVDSLGETPVRLEFQGEERAAVVYRSPWTSRARVSIPANAVMEFAVGAGDLAADAPLFEVVVSVEIEGKTRELLRESSPMILPPDPEPFQGAWVQHRLDLSEFSGQTADVFIELSALSWPSRFQVPMSVPLITGDPAPGAGQGPNIVLFAIDTLRSDHLGVYGHRYPTSPNIDKLAAAGAVFLNHYAQGANTFTSFPSLFTGQSPSRLAVGFDLTATRLSDSAVTLTEILASHGYRTAAIIPDAFAGPALNLMQGFDEVRISRNAGSAKVFEMTTEWLQTRNAGDPPFFLFVHVMEVHDPYGTKETPVEEIARFGGGQVQAPAPYEPLGRIVPLLFHSNLYLRRFYTDLAPYLAVPSGAEQDFIKALYDSDIARTDAFIARSMEMLRSRGLAGDTTVALVADHGEAFWEHDSTGAMHGVSAYQEIIRTPFILAGRNVRPATRVHAPTANIDVLPSLLHVAGVPWKNISDGVAVLEAGEDAIADRVVTSQNRLHDYASIQGDYKLLVDRYGHTRLFNLADDPSERHDVSAAQPERAATLTRSLFEQLDHRLAEEWIVAFSGVGSSPCRFTSQITTDGRFTYVDSTFYAGVNELDLVRLSPDRRTLDLRATSKEVDRSIMFEISPPDANVSFSISAEPSACAKAFLGDRAASLTFTAPNRGAVEPRRFTPGTDAGVFVGRLPAWKPRTWTVLNLTQTQSTSAAGALSPELRDRLRSLGYIQ